MRVELVWAEKETMYVRSADAPEGGFHGCAPPRGK